MAFLVNVAPFTIQAAHKCFLNHVLQHAKQYDLLIAAAFTSVRALFSQQAHHNLSEITPETGSVIISILTMYSSFCPDIYMVDFRT